MEKNYFRFIAVVLLSSLALSALSFYAIFSVLGVSIDQDFDGYTFHHLVFYVAGITATMVTISGLFSFLVELDHTGIKIGIPRKKIAWSEVQKVKLVGIPMAKSLNRIVISGVGSELEIKLFVFKSQEAFIAEIRRYLPWAGDLAADNVPLEIEK
jgi:hypothetical protein